MGQLASHLSYEQSGSLSSIVEQNLNAWAISITVWSGMTMGEDERSFQYTNDDVDKEIGMETFAGKMQQRLRPASTAHPAESERHKDSTSL